LNKERSTDRRIRRTRKALHQALLTLLLERQFDQITIRDIAAAAGVSYPTYFRHYPDKEHLLAELADEEIAALLDLTLPLFAQCSSASTLALCEHVKANHRLWEALVAGGAADNIRSAFIAQTEMRTHQWPAEAGWLPPDIGTAILCGVTLDVLGWWLGKVPEKGSEEVARILDRFFSQLSDNASAAGPTNQRRISPGSLPQKFT
jgi:AcrR family transcriptional regulator